MTPRWQCIGEFFITDGCTVVVFLLHFLRRKFLGSGPRDIESKEVGVSRTAIAAKMSWGEEPPRSGPECKLCLHSVESGGAATSARSSVVERHTDNVKVEGPIPSARTNHVLFMEARNAQATAARAAKTTGALR